MKNNVYELALEHYGAKNQMLQAIEEMAELMVAINKYKRAIDAGEETANEREHIAEEIADVKIMMEQLAIEFGTAKVDAYATKKLIRLANRIDADKRKTSPVLSTELMDDFITGRLAVAVTEETMQPFLAQCDNNGVRWSSHISPTMLNPFCIYSGERIYLQVEDGCLKWRETAPADIMILGLEG